MKEEELEGMRYVVVTNADPDSLSFIVSELMKGGWLLHGGLMIQAMADVTRPTYSRAIYIQALYKTA